MRQFDARKPFHMFLAEVAGHNHARWITVPMRQRHAIHLVSNERGRLHRFLQRDGISIIVYAPKTNACSLRKWCRRFEQIAQHHAFPDSVADQSGIKSIADAHQCRLLFDRSHRFQILEPIHAGLLHEPVYFQVPELNIHARIDNVFGHAVKLIVWSDRLDGATFILQAVVAEACRAIKSARQAQATASQRDADRAQYKCAAPYGGSEFSMFGSNCCSCEKLKTRHERPFENEHTEPEAHERN